MDEIKVIEDTGVEGDIPLMSSEERELYFEYLSENNPEMPKYYYISLNEMQNEIIDIDNRNVKPDLKELLIRKIIQLSRINAKSAAANNIYAIPIIPKFKTINIRRGGAVEPKKIQKPPSDNLSAVKVRFDTNISTITEDNIRYISPKNEEIEVVGLFINPKCWNDVKNTVDHVIIGNYTYEYLAKSCEDVFLQPESYINIAGKKHSEPFKIIFNEYNESQIATALGAIYDYISGVENHHRKSAWSIFNQIQIGIDRADTDHGPITRQLHNRIANVYEPREPYALTQSEPEKSQFLSELEKLHLNSYSQLYNTNLSADLRGYGLDDIYNRAKITGQDNDDVRDMLNRYKERQIRINFQKQLREKATEETNRLNVYRLVIENKLGAKRLHDIDHELTVKPTLKSRAENILELLKPPERKIIKAEYERRQKYIDAMLTNKCPHVQLYRKLRMSRYIERTKKLYSEIKPFLKPNTSGMITCSNCNYDVMCPHVRDYIELEIRGATFAEIKGKLTRYIEEKPLNDAYYCKICGEIIASAEVDTVKRDIQNEIDDDLKALMWGEITIIMRHLKFSALFNAPQLINAVRNAIYPYIFEIEKQILKSKTNTVEEIKAKKRMFVTIYAMAYFIHMMLTKNKDLEISFKNMKAGGKKPIVEMLRHAIEIIISSKNVIIREIPGMTNDLIKTKIIEAYKVLSSEGAVVIEYSEEAEDLLITLLLDPVYGYIYTVNTIDELINGQNTRKNKFSRVDKIKDYLGTIVKIEKQSDVYENAIAPKFDQRWRLKEFDTITLPKYSAYSGNKSIAAAAYRGYIARSFDLFNQRLRGIFREFLYMDSGSDDVALRPEHEKIAQAYSELAHRENIIETLQARESLKAFYSWNQPISRRVDRIKTNLGRIYDENGHGHRWDIYVLDNGTETSYSKIAKDIENGIAFTFHISDRKCSICGSLYSEAENLDIDKIRKSLDEKYNINNFFRFYENRCPAGKLHEYNNDKCVKCGISVKMHLEQSAKDALEIYRKYTNVYQQERIDFAADIDSKFPEPRPAPVDNSWAETYAGWSYKEEILLDLAGKLKINFRFLSCLGGIERREYSEVANGIYIPPETATRNDTRIFVIDSYIRTIITEYNQLRYFARLTKPSADLTLIVENSGISRHRITEVISKLPEVIISWSSRLLWFQNNRKPREIVPFCIQNLCEMCLRIWADREAETERLRHEFVRYIIAKILRADEMTTAYSSFNWALLYPSDVKETYDSNYNPDLDDEPDQYDDEQAEDFGDTADPMRGADIDVDDVDMGEDDGDTNGIKVGDDLGL